VKKKKKKKRKKKKKEKKKKKKKKKKKRRRKRNAHLVHPFLCTRVDIFLKRTYLLKFDLCLTVHHHCR